MNREKPKMISNKESMEVSNEVRVKNEPICESQSISQTRETKQLIKHERKSISINDSKRTREDILKDDHPNNEKPNKRKRQSILAMGIKEEPIDSEIQTSKSHIDVKAEEEEKFSATEEFTNKISIAFLNEETAVTSSDNQPNKPQRKKTNKLDNSK